MARTPYDYGALTVGATFTNAETTKPVAMGATQAILTNGTLTVAADAPAGLVNSIEGTSQGTSGTSYVYETLGATTFDLTVIIYWKMPTSIGTLGANAMVWVGTAGGSRVFAINLLSTEQIRLINSAGSTVATTTYSGGFVAGQWYRTEIGVHVDSTTAANGTYSMATYLEHGLSALANTSVAATSNFNTTAMGIVRHGPRGSTGTADENIRVRILVDAASSTSFGPETSGVTVNVPAPCTITYTALAPTVLTAQATVVAVPDPAFMTVASLAPASVRAAGRVVVPAPASVTVTALVPVVSVPTRVVVPDPVTMTVTALAPSVNASSSVSVLPPTAALEIRALAPSVIGYGTVTIAVPAPASVTVTALVPVVRARALAVVPSPATVTLTALEPTVLGASRVIVPAPASMTVTALAPTVIGRALVDVPEVSVSFYAIAPIVFAGSVIDVETTGGVTWRAIAPQYVGSPASTAPFPDVPTLDARDVPRLLSVVAPLPVH